MLKHQHVIINAKIKSPPRANQTSQMNIWFRELIEAIGMKLLLGPFTVYSDMVGNRGFTGISAIETSSITLHVWDEIDPGLLRLDVYTCSDLNVQTVFDHLKVFDPVEIDYVFFDRDDDLKLVERGKISYE